VVLPAALIFIAAVAALAVASRKLSHQSVQDQSSRSGRFLPIFVVVGSGVALVSGIALLIAIGASIYDAS
jgi:hypothetical protein